MATGTLANAGDTVSVTTQGAVSCAISGIYTGGQVAFEVSPDGVTWFPALSVPIDGIGQPAVTAILRANASRSWNIASLAQARIRAVTAMGGTANVSIVSGSA